MDKPTPQSGDKSTARSPMGNSSAGTPTASGEAVSGGVPLRPQGCYGTNVSPPIVNSSDSSGGS